MKNTYGLLLISLVLTGYICSATTLGLGSLFGSRKDTLAETNEGDGGSVKDGEQHQSHDNHHTHEHDHHEHDHHEHDHHEHDHHEHDHHDDHHTHKPTSKPSHAPLLPAIPHPADTPLNPQNNPHHPLNHLPSLPSLPSLPHRETILATKTVFVEVTSKVHQNPVCIAVQDVKPPCLPVHEYHKPVHRPTYQPYRPYPHPHLHQREESEELHPFIQPTASVEILEPTRILSGITLSEAAPVEETYIEPSHEDSNSNSRSGRYIEVATPTPAAPFRANSEITDQPDEASVRLVEGIFHRQPVTHYTTKTLWVTKVEKYIDHRVTATLEVKNCIPSELHIPLCGSAATHHAPSYVPHKDGSFLENNSGHHSGLLEILEHHNKGKDKQERTETENPSDQ